MILHKKHLDGSFPYAFTEQSVAMLSSVLNSERAIKVNIEIMRTFVRLRRILTSNRELSKRLDELEKKYDAQFKIVFDAIRQLKPTFGVDENAHLRSPYQGIRKLGCQESKDRRREIKEVKRDLRISLLIFTTAWVGGTSLGQTLTHWKTVLHPQTPF